MKYGIIPHVERGNDSLAVEAMREDRTLFSDLFKRVVQSAPNEDPTGSVLAAIGGNVGADRCYAYRFWEPGQSSKCTNTHEWCAEGIAPAIGEQQACDLAVFEEFNDCITSGRDYMAADASALSAVPGGWPALQGVRSMIAVPIVGEGGLVIGFVGFDFVKTLYREFSDRIAWNIHAAADILITCHRLHERDMAVQDIVQGKNEYEENEREFERAIVELQKDVGATHPKRMLGSCATAWTQTSATSCRCVRTAAESCVPSIC